MLLVKLAVTILLAIAAANVPAHACILRAERNLDDVKFADLVVVGRVVNYKIIRREESWPKLSDFARFDIEVGEVLIGERRPKVSVTWDNSTFGEPENMPAGPFLIALRDPKSPIPPLRGPSPYIGPNPDPAALTVLQAPRASPFIFEATSEEAKAVRKIIAARSR